MKTKLLAILAAVVGASMAVVALLALKPVPARSSTDASEAMANSDSVKQLYTCGMHPQVVQDHPGNCPICHMKLVPMRDNANRGATVKDERRVLYYWDPMLGPSSISDKPGKSAMGMEMVPVYADEHSAGSNVHIDPVIIQNMGVRTDVVTRGPLQRTVRTVGVLMVPDPGLHDITLRINGWIEKLYADTDGMSVKKDQPLFDVYSPDLQIAGEELIMSVQGVKSLSGQSAEPARKQAESMVESAKRKLRQWGVADQDIEAIAQADHAPRTVTFRSPADGHIVDKQIVQGSSVQTGTKLMRIEDHSQLWLDMQVFEEQLPWIALGQPVQAAIDGLSETEFAGKISFIYPHVDHMTRAVTVRAVLPNPKHELRPGMYATAKIVTEPVSNAMLVPPEAVIDTGTRQIAFVALPEGAFAPRNVRTGLRGDDRVQILEGLATGENVVTSGQFLFDVESRTTEAIQKLRSGNTSREPAIAPPVMSSPMSAPATSAPVAQTKPLSIAHCPMKKADWLQSDDDIANPYFGQEMSGCGAVTKHVAAPAENTPLKKAVDAYFVIQRDLNADKLNPANLALMNNAVAALDGEKFVALRSATGELSTSKDIAAARLCFKTVSDVLIQLLTEAAK